VGLEGGRALGGGGRKSPFGVAVAARCPCPDAAGRVIELPIAGAARMDRCCFWVWSLLRLVRVRRRGGPFLRLVRVRLVILKGRLLVGVSK
jgi:hypothetical protein